MKTMILPIKRRWYDMILAGIKLEEYRQRKEYWDVRIIPLIPYEGKRYVTILLRNGYGKKAPTLRCFGFWDVGFGVPEWGAPTDEEVYRFHIMSVKEIRA